MNQSILGDFSFFEIVIYLTLAKQVVYIIENFVVFGQFKIKCIIKNFEIKNLISINSVQKNKLNKKKLVDAGNRT